MKRPVFNIIKANGTAIEDFLVRRGRRRRRRRGRRHLGRAGRSATARARRGGGKRGCGCGRGRGGLGCGHGDDGEFGKERRRQRVLELLFKLPKRAVARHLLVAVALEPPAAHFDLDPRETNNSRFHLHHR